MRCYTFCPRPCAAAPVYLSPALLRSVACPPSRGPPPPPTYPPRTSRPSRPWGKEIQQPQWWSNIMFDCMAYGIIPGPRCRCRARCRPAPCTGRGRGRGPWPASCTPPPTTTPPCRTTPWRVGHHHHHYHHYHQCMFPVQPRQFCTSPLCRAPGCLGAGAGAGAGTRCWTTPTCVISSCWSVP